MKYTGERIVPDDGELYSLFKRHLALYEYAFQYAKNKVVLDVGSGEGYGPNLLAEKAAKVTAIDNSLEAVEHAQRTYSKDNLEYTMMDATQLEFGDDSFDLVVAIESIEHLTDYKKFLDKVCRILKNTGLFILTTPHVRKPSPDHKPGSHYHYKEFSSLEFNEELKEYFNLVEIMGVKIKGTTFKDILKKIDIFRTRRLLAPEIRGRIHKKVDKNMSCEVGSSYVKESLNLIGICRSPKKGE
jgi:ubiquinone/menaquinone biosynthesis C-methylase UbiE